MYGYSGHQMTDEEREQLILEHLPQVKLIARRIQERLPESISLDDLVSTGVLGLISAIDNFDPVHQVKLKTYAEYKIRGAILDSLRGLDWAPRQKRRKAKQIEAAISSAEQKLKRAPIEDEIAQELEISLDEYHGWLVEIRGLNVASLEYAAGDQGLLDLLHEEGLAPEVGERRLGEPVAGRANGDDLHLGASRAQPRRHRLGLGEREAATAGAEAHLHRSRPPEPRRSPKTSETTSIQRRP